VPEDTDIQQSWGASRRCRWHAHIPHAHIPLPKKVPVHRRVCDRRNTGCISDGPVRTFTSLSHNTCKAHRSPPGRTQLRSKVTNNEQGNDDKSGEKNR
jgi:hypothetical protein